MEKEKITPEPPPEIPEDPILDDGVTHIVTIFPNGLGWSDVIRVDSGNCKQKAILRWNEAPIVINNDTNWRQKLREIGQKAKESQT